MRTRQFAAAAGMVVGMALLAACGSSTSTPPSQAEIRSLIRQELRAEPAPTTSTATPTTVVPVATGSAAALTAALQTAEGQKALDHAVLKALQSPDVAKALQSQVHSAVMQLVVKGAGSGGGGSSGGSSGGGSSGGGSSSGGSGGG